MIRFFLSFVKYHNLYLFQSIEDEGYSELNPKKNLLKLKKERPRSLPPGTNLHHSVNIINNEAKVIFTFESYYIYFH